MLTATRSVRKRETRGSIEGFIGLQEGLNSKGQKGL